MFLSNSVSDFPYLLHLLWRTKVCHSITTRQDCSEVPYVVLGYERLSWRIHNISTTVRVTDEYCNNTEWGTWAFPSQLRDEAVI